MTAVFAAGEPVGSDRAWVLSGPAMAIQVGEHNTQNVFLPAAEARWPVHSGPVPPLADHHQERPEVGALLDRAATGATAGSTHVLVGLGGVGKSQLAAAAAHARASEVDLLVWVDASTRDAVVTAYAQTAAQLGYRGLLDAEKAAAWFVQWLRSADERTWLVVLDDVVDPAHLRRLWPSGPLGNAIITTRRADNAMFEVGRERVDVGLFSADQARRYLTEKLTIDTGAPNEVDELAADLQFLPLALAQAAAFILDRGETCAGYRRRFADKRHDLPELFPADALADDYRATVATTWSLSVEAADALAPVGLSRPLLEVASMLGPNGFPQELLTSTEVAAYVSARLAVEGAAVTEAECRYALRNLARLSLVALTPNGDGRFSVGVHALVQRATHEQLEPALRHQLAWRTASSTYGYWPDSDREMVLTRSLQANTEALLDHSGDDLWHPYQHPLVNRLGRSIREIGLVTEAVEIWCRIYRTSHRVLGNDHPSTLVDRHEYASCLNGAGDHTGAVTELEQLLADEIRVLGADHPEILTTRHSLATDRGEAGDFARALAELEAILPARIRQFGADNPHTLTTRQNIARFRGETGAPAAAAAEFARVVKDRTRVLGADNRETLESRSGLAYWKGKAGTPRRAHREFAALADKYTELFGPNDINALKARHDAAKWLGFAGDASDAVAALAELVDDATRVLTAAHVETIAVRGSYADWVGEAGDPDRAVELLRQVVADVERLLGPDDLQTYANRNNLAWWLWESNRKDEAVDVLKGLHADMSRMLDADNPRVASVRRTLAARLAEED